MTPDDFRPEDDHQDTSAHDEQVRHLLAAAAKPVTPMPDHVARRLDDVLGDLVSERESEAKAAAHAEGTGAPRASAPSERRRSVWPKLLVAAAVTSVVGFGVANVAGGPGSVQSSDSSAASDARAEQGGSGESKQETVEPRTTREAAVPELQSESLTTDARRVAELSLPAALASDRTGALPRCEVPQLSRGDASFGVRLDGEPTTMVVHAPADGSRRVEFYACDDADSPTAVTSIEGR